MTLIETRLVEVTVMSYNLSESGIGNPFASHIFIV